MSSGNHAKRESMVAITVSSTLEVKFLIKAQLEWVPLGWDLYRNFTQAREGYSEKKSNSWAKLKERDHAIE